MMMRRCFQTKGNRSALALIFVLVAAALHAQRPVIKVDFNMSGRKLTEVNQIGYTPWSVTRGGPDTLVKDGIRFIVSKGQRGKNLGMTWFKAGVRTPNLARFTDDGLTVVDGDFQKGSVIELRIQGLPSGHHQIITYHNIIDDVTRDEVCPMEILVDGQRQKQHLIPTVRVTGIPDCQSAVLEVNAHPGKDVVIWFKAESSSSQPIKNVIINGFQLNGINPSNQARSPLPANQDEHIKVNKGGGYILRWGAGNGASAHDVYFGTDAKAVANADHQSPEYKGHQSLTDTSFAVNDLNSRLSYYWRIDEIDNKQTYKGAVWAFRTRQLAFPGAEGYGRFARGGRGGKVVIVTNLNDDGPGSLRDAVTRDIGPRTVVFAVAGMITLKSRLVLSQPYVTVAGQTAPGKGICIRSAPFGVTGNDCIARFIRLRLGGRHTYDGMGLTGADNSIMDHCSISWTIDESFSSRGAHNITLQRTLISEAQNAAGHHKYPAGKEHGFAATIGGNIGSFHHNLLADNYGRNWSLGGGLVNSYYGGRMDITNNVVYNWGHRATDGGAKEVNFVGNYYKPGAGTDFFYAYNAQHENVGKGMQRCYFHGNVMPGHFDESNQQAGRKVSHSNGDTSSYQTYVDQPFFPSYVTTQSARDAYKNVLSDVGASRPQLDKHDQRMIKETLNGTYSVVGSVTHKKGFPDKVADAGGYENYPEVHRPDNWDTDKDGLPDWWEIVKGLNPRSAKGDFSQTNADDNKDGLTNLNDYLDWMAQPHYGRKNGTIAIDLKTLTRGYTASPEFTASHITNGTLKISPDGIAVFTPKNSPAGKVVMGGFDFTVKDKEGSQMTRHVNTLSGLAL